MPVKRRKVKVRREDLEAWSMLFKSSWDFFHELPEIGVPTDAYGQVDRDVAEAAWHRLGAAYLENEAANARLDDRDSWALREFGKPPR